MADQNAARQEVLMKDLGMEQVFIDRMSGKNTDHPALKKLMGFVSTLGLLCYMENAAVTSGE